MQSSDSLCWEQLVGHQPPSNTPLKSSEDCFEEKFVKEQDVFRWPEESESAKENYQNLFPNQGANTQNTFTLVELKDLIERNWNEEDSNMVQLQNLKQRRPLEQRDYIYNQKMSSLELKKSNSNSSSYHGSNKQSPQLRKTQSSEQGLKQAITQFNIQQVMRYQDDPTVMKKKQEMRDHTKWLKNVQQNKGFVKDLKFKLNQLADANYDVISDQILQIVYDNDEFLDISLALIIDKASNENKYRSLYSKICAEISKDKSIKKKLDDELIKRCSERQSQQDIDAHLSTFQEEEKLIYLSKKKKKQVGLLKFCCQLFKDRVFKVFLIDDLIFILINQYLKQEGDQKYNEESLEFLIELILFVGKDYFKVGQHKDDVADEKKYFKNLKIDEDISFHFSQKGLLNIIQKIQQKHTISQRVSLLLQNMFEMMENNWEFKKRKGSNDSLSDKLSDKQDDQKKSVKVEKLQKIHENKEKEDETSVMKPLTLKDIVLYVEQAFKNPEPERFCRLLEKQLLDRIPNSELLNKFWICFLEKLLDPTKENVAKGRYGYEIFKNYQLFSDDAFIIEQINNVNLHQLSQLFVYDLIESPYGEQLMVNLLQPFFTNNINTINKLYFSDDDEIQSFTISYLTTIFAKNTNQDQKLIINGYISQFNADFQNQFWKQIE